MKLKKQILFPTMIVLLAIASARGALFTENFTGVNAAIPDGNPNGVAVSGSVSDVFAGNVVLGVTVSLNISGGYNGDLYSYLVAPNGTLVVLMNQPGVSGGNPFGATGAGMNITLQDVGAANGSIQSETSGAILSGTYSAAGNLFDFNGSVADGNWELFVADLASGGGTGTLNSWSVDITAVPEPGTPALIIFLFLLGVKHFAARRRSDY